MRKQKIKIVFVPLSYNMHLSYHHGIGILSAVAKQYGADAVVYQVHEDTGNPPVPEKCAREISSFNPDFVCISATSLEWEFAKVLALELKKFSNAKVVVGGPHPTFCNIVGNELDIFDYIVLGEGEEIIKKLALGELPGSKMVRGELIADLDKLPFSDRESFEMEKIISARHGIVDFITQRGCPYNCSYCSNYTLREIYGVKYLRRRSVENIIGEIKDVIRRYPCKMIFFHDDIFTLREDWVKEFCDKYVKEIRMPWMINSQVNHMSDEIIEVLARAGCMEVKLGVESGDEELRNMVLNKKISDDKLKDRFGAVRRGGIRTFAFMMHGIPGEKNDSYFKSARLMAEIKPNTIRSSIYFPLPNTVLGSPFYGNHKALYTVLWGDIPTSSLYGEKILSNFYMFPWRINLFLGLKEYEDLIKKYSEKTCAPEELRRADLKMSEKMSSQGKVHYGFGFECSLLKLKDGGISFL